MMVSVNLLIHFLETTPKSQCSFCFDIFFLSVKHVWTVKPIYQKWLLLLVHTWKKLVQSISAHIETQYFLYIFLIFCISFVAEKIVSKRFCRWRLLTFFFLQKKMLYSICYLFLDLVCNLLQWSSSVINCYKYKYSSKPGSKKKKIMFW